MLDILEEFAPKETITIIVERRWKYRNPVKIVKQKFEIPVLVIRNTGKAVLVTKENGSSWADGKRGEALWIPSFAMDSVGDRKYKIRYNKIDGDDFIKFIKRFGYKPKEEIEESLVMKGFTEFLEEREVIMTHEIEKARFELEQAENKYDLETAAKLRHGTIPKLEKELTEFNNIQNNVYLNLNLGQIF